MSDKLFKYANIGMGIVIAITIAIAGAFFYTKQADAKAQDQVAEESQELSTTLATEPEAAEVTYIEVPGWQDRSQIKGDKEGISLDQAAGNSSSNSSSATNNTEVSAKTEAKSDKTESKAPAVQTQPSSAATSSAAPAEAVNQTQIPQTTPSDAASNAASNTASNTASTESTNAGTGETVSSTASGTESGADSSTAAGTESSTESVTEPVRNWQLAVGQSDHINHYYIDKNAADKSDYNNIKIEAHIWEYSSNGECGHYKRCKVCGYVEENEAHDFDDNGRCKYCGYEASSSNQ